MKEIDSNLNEGENTPANDSTPQKSNETSEPVYPVDLTPSDFITAGNKSDLTKS
jgi:hypothetical protein